MFKHFKNNLKINLYSGYKKSALSLKKSGDIQNKINHNKSFQIIFQLYCDISEAVLL